MIVCQCKGVSDRTIRRLVRQGTSTPPDIARACAAGACCGGCRPTIEELIDRALRASRAALDDPKSRG